MSDPLTFVTTDVFTDEPYSGNPLAIVLGADTLSDTAMQTIAREFNLSETIFVQTPDDPANTAKVRIFFPTAEIPFAGHPTIGCAIYLARQHHPEDDFETEIRLEEVAGLVPVKVICRNGKITAELTAPVVPHAVSGARMPDQTEIAAAVGLDPGDIGFGHHRPGVWQGGPRFAFVPVADTAALAAAQPCEPAWSTFMHQAGVDSAYLYTPGPSSDYQGRMYSPTAGIPEDPATGSASCILAAQLLASNALGDGETAVSLRQGVEMGRPSVLSLRIDVANGALARVRLAGTAVQISRGQITPPAS